MRSFIYLLTGLNKRIFPEFTFHWGSEWWFLIAGIIAGAALLYNLIKDLKELKKNEKSSYIFSILFIFSLIFIMLIFLSGLPTLDFYKIKLKPMEGVVLIDESRSMTIPIKGKSRIEWVKEFLITHKKNFLKFNSLFPLSFWGWGEGIKLLAKFEPGSLTPQGIVQISKKLRPQFFHSNLKRAIEKVKNSVGENKIAWFLIITDGQTDKKVEQEGKIPFYVVTPPESNIEDISIIDTEVPVFAYVRNPVDITLKIFSTFHNLKKVPVELFEDEKFIKNFLLTIKSGEGEYHLTIRPDFTGEHIYTVRIPLSDKILINNSSSFILKVLLDKIRVLQIIGRPTWDSRFLRLYLKNDPRIDLISFTILRSNQDNPMSNEDELSLIPFPSNALFSTELNNFDVVILQNFNYLEYLIFNYQLLLENLKRFVTDRGGGLVLIGGALSFSEGDYENTPIDDVMPVKILDGMGNFDLSKVKLHLTNGGTIHPITSLGMPPTVARKIWDAALPIDGENLVGRLRKGSVSLLTNKKNGNIIIAARGVGRGRTLSIATDSLWELAFHNPENEKVRRAYFTFWKRAIRWLINDESFKQLKIKLSKRITLPGEKIRILITAFKNNFEPFKKEELRLEISCCNKKTPLKITGEKGNYSAVITSSSPGLYTVKISGYSQGKGIAEDEAKLITLPLQYLEKKDIRISKKKIIGKYINGVPDMLISGVILSPENKMVTGSKKITLYNNIFFLGFFALLLVIFWALRRRLGLL